MALSRITNYIEADGADLNLQSSDTTITANSILGSINFKAPNEASGTDSILLASKIEAVAEGTFSASSNATSVIISTASSEAAGTAGGKFTFGSTGNLTIKDLRTADGSSPRIALETGDTDIAQDDVLGDITFQAPDEGTGTDAILTAAAIAAVSEGDFSSSSNATSLFFKTGSSEAATNKLQLTSAGDLKILTDGASLLFGADGEIELKHVADDGLILKHHGTGDGKEPSLTFQAGDNDIAQDDVLGSIFFQAPDEGAGTDAVLVAAGIEAVSEGDFSSSSNATKLSFKTGSSEAATEKMSLSSAGTLEVLKIGSGTAVNLKMDGTTIGGLGVVSDRVYLEAEGSHSVYLDASANNFNPGSDTGTDNDGNIDLGASFARWKDLYIGGGIHVGGTGSANKLDDYEEGTYTVTMTCGTSGSITLNGSYNTGTYTKIGRLVHVAADVRISSVSSPNGTTFISIPFTALNNGNATSSNYLATAGVSYQSGQGGSYFSRSLANTTTAEVLYDTDGNYFTLQAQNGGLGASDQFSFSLTYMTE